MHEVKLFFSKLKYSMRRGWRKFTGALGGLFRPKANREDADAKMDDRFDDYGKSDTRETPRAQGDFQYQQDKNGPVGGETRMFSPLRETQFMGGYEDEAEAEEEPLFVERAKSGPFLLSILFTTVKLGALALALLGFGGLGAVVGVAKAYVETTPTLDRAQLIKSDRTSYLYDKDGNLITSIADIEYRDWVDIENIPERLKNAFIAVEDVRFYKHEGVDVKRLVKAAIEVMGNSNSSGGSTITQQLIKNKILSAERTYKRKIQEAYLALELEKEIKKEDILEAYLNDIHLGSSNYGVKTAAKDYFDKDLNELTIRECAMLAGLTQNPYRYNPRLNKYSNGGKNWFVTENRTSTVLSLMYKNGFITQAEYEEAKKEELQIVEVSKQKQMYIMPHFVEYAIHDVVTHLLMQRGLPDTNINRNTVENELRTGGYKIYTTVDPDIQNTVQRTLEEYEKYPPLADPDNNETVEKLADNTVIKTIQPQASAVVMDYHTGELRAVVGSRETPTIRKSLNRARQSYMEVGSSIKPLAVYGPALDAGVSPATILANLPAPIEGWGTETGYPAIGDKKWIGPITVRRGIVSSLNVAAARTLYEHVSPEVGAQYLVNLGAVASEINADGPGLALGTSGLTTIQMAAAYGAIAAGGEYKEPLSFTKVVDSAGNVVLGAESVRRRAQVFKPSTAWLLVDILEEAVKSGTGTNARMKGMSVAGKTGTNSEYKSVYFAGMTPYYSAAVWIGHDQPSLAPLKRGSSGGTYAAPVWRSFMEEIHAGLPDKKIIDASPSELGLEKKTVCSVSGLLATEACMADPDGHKPVEDWFVKENAPTEFCDMHAATPLCSATNQPATANCPTTYVNAGAVVLIRPGSYFDQFTDAALAMGFTSFARTPMTLEQYRQWAMSGSGSCSLHGGGWGYDSGGFGGDTAPNRQDLLFEAQDLFNEVSGMLANDAALDETDRADLKQAKDSLNSAMTSSGMNALYTAIEEARREILRIKDRIGG